MDQQKLRMSQLLPPPLRVLDQFFLFFSFFFNRDQVPTHLRLKSDTEITGINGYLEMIFMACAVSCDLR